jgi:hypothetical protein
LGFGEGSDYLLDLGKFEMIEEYLGYTKKLFINKVKVDPQILQNLLNLLPNLEALHIFCVQSARRKQSKWDLKCTKIELIEIYDAAGFESLLGSLEKCAIKELKYYFDNGENSTVLQKFFKVQEKNLKTLYVAGKQFVCNFNFLVGLKDLRLEHLEFSYSESRSVSLEFLKQQVDLKFLKLRLYSISGATLNMICELKGLESLELVSRVDVIDSSGLNNIHKLGKLKKGISRNILDHMQFGVFNDLEELHASFEGASVETAQEMKRITPNLKKIVICSASSETINALLTALENLEALKFDGFEWDVLSEKVHPKIKQFVFKYFNFPAEQFTKVFPNLEYLKVGECSFEAREPFFITLLSGLKRLKTLYMRIWISSKLDPEATLQCFQEHGEHLEDPKIIFNSKFKQFKFVVEKGPGGSFCIQKVNFSLTSYWMRNVF